MMGGHLVVESTPGVGSKFSFNLSFDTIDIPVTEPAKIISDGELQKPVFEGEILVCEDNIMNQQVIRDHLSRIGLLAVIAGDGKEGVEKVHRRMKNSEKPFDLIFMDIHMPVMDGLEAASKITAMCSQTPIVAMTANVMANERELYMNSGMSDYVSKPFTSQELWRCLLKYLKPVGQKTIAKAAQTEADERLELILKTNFVKHNQTKFDEISGTIKTGDIKTAHRLAHTLKSNAAQIGKIHLQKAAAGVEEMLKDGKNKVTDEHLSLLKIELNAVLKELEPLLKAPPKDEARVSPKAVFNKARAMDMANELEPLLKSGNPDCLNFINDIHTIPGSERLIHLMENYDFEPALLALDKLREEWL
jgi:CheY-like chemotaxis protein